MQRITLVVADAARARLFTFTPFRQPANGMPHLVERADLVDPARRLRPSEQLSETRPPSNRSPSGVGFAADDHRQEYLHELDRRFAAEIMRQAEEIITETDSDRLVVVASPNMLGLLREHTAPLRRDGLDIEESAMDLTHEAAPRLERHLTEAGLLPALPRTP